MRTCNRLLAVTLMFITSFPDLKAETFKVTGYVGEEVILKCQFVPGSKNFTITQLQWEFESTTILVFNPEQGMNIKDSPLKERINLTEQSLKIRDVEMTDSGNYTCSVAAFPSGSHEETIKLVVVTGDPVSEPTNQAPMPAGQLCAIIISAVLLLGILTAAAYLTYVRRHKAARRLEVHIDTSNRVASVNRPSYIYKDPVSTEEMVYADVRPKRTRNSGSSLIKIPRAAAKTEEVTYAEVRVYHQRPNLETVFSV
ncbi:PREDICTED: T-cell immunoreceptor with Ig and ITIM domains-like [Poecilia mexicana]|uniref:T-cell immunoreceptor with Ig and ITIM domains-like n=1 Tax=Poecilia mexicana TaxID=48701 RepID=UPI00072E86EF|nr:PREDICTED: T-cell immunoreceptor with Ig and ITIM domains-like [Poecilia mexicana]